MLLRVFGFLLLIMALTGCQRATSTPYSLQNSRIETLTSNKLGEYKITTYWPESTTPQGGWPIIYLLDGDSYFLSSAQLVKNLSCPRCKLSEGIIVAIDYIGPTRRAHDYLPAPDPFTVEILPSGQPNLPQVYGGADDFLAFIQFELKPLLNQRFTINTQQQTLFGHSYGGLFTLYSFLNHPDYFSHYVASSPSLWFSGGYVMQQLTDTLQTHQLSLSQPTQLMISVGGMEQSLNSEEKAQPQSKQQLLLTHRQNRAIVDNAQRFFTQLQQAQLTNLSLSYQIYTGQSHQTAPFYALQDGIQKGFDK